MSAGPEWGPLARLAGIWEGDTGEDVAYSNEKGERRPHAVPRAHRTQALRSGGERQPDPVRLDYRMAAWRGTEENPFHTEVGYWLWDATDGQVMRCFLIPRALPSSPEAPWPPMPPLSPGRRGGLGDVRDPLQPVPGRPGPLRPLRGGHRCERGRGLPLRRGIADRARQVDRAPQPHRQQHPVQDRRRSPSRSGPNPMR